MSSRDVQERGACDATEVLLLYGCMKQEFGRGGIGWPSSLLVVEDDDLVMRLDMYVCCLFFGVCGIIPCRYIIWIQEDRQSIR